MLVDPSVNRMACLPSVDLTTLIGDAVFSWYLQSQVILGWWEKESEMFPCNMDKAQPSIEQKGNQSGILTGWSSSLRGL
jgi:hypothetical protein